MGQQQVILLILVTVIVGIATVVAIDTMFDTRQQANYDSIRQKMMDATTFAHMYYRRNSMLGGGGNSFENITLTDLQIDTSDTNLGRFSITDASEESLTLTAVPVSGGDDIICIIYKDRIEFQEADSD